MREVRQRRSELRVAGLDCNWTREQPGDEQAADGHGAERRAVNKGGSDEYPSPAWRNLAFPPACIKRVPSAF